MAFDKANFDKLLLEIYNTQLHINNCDKYFLFDCDKRYCHLNHLNEIMIKLHKLQSNDINLSTMAKCTCPENTIEICYNFDLLIDLCKNEYCAIKKMIVDMGKNIGFLSIKHGLKLFLGSEFKMYFSAENYETMKIFNKIFVPTSCEITNCDKQNNFMLERISNSNCDALLNRCAKLYINIIGTKFIVFHGFFKTDSIGVILTGTNFCNNKITQTKNKLIELIKTNDINRTFCDKYVDSINYYEYLLYSPNELYEILMDDSNLYTNVIRTEMSEIVSMFVDSSIMTMFKIIKLLMIYDNTNLACLLFDIIYNKKNSILSDIIYSNLNCSSQSNLKNVLCNLNLELTKIKKKKDDVGNLNKLVILSTMPDNVKRICVNKLADYNSENADSVKIKEYVQYLINFPWPSSNETNIFDEIHQDLNKSKAFIDKCMQTMNSHIYGQTECKEVIKETICKWISNPKARNNSIGLVGSPGVGKTLFAKTLSETLNIPFVQISLGGQNDGDILHGHSYVYNSSQPGMIIKKMIEAKKSRCIMYFDELDKTSVRNGHNEIYDILIHLTDMSMNSNFQDRFFQEITFPLNNVLFVFSYNNSSKIDSILLDRIQEIKVQSYSVKEKIKIANCHLIEQICKNIGYDFNQLNFSSEVLEYIIENYTLESGVRDLNRKIEKIILKLNVERIYNNTLYDSQIIKITQEHVDMYLKDSIVSVRKIHDVPQIGIVNGLYVTNCGAGGIVPIQVLRYYQSEHNKFTLKLTGSQGRIMKESAHYALTIASNILSEDNKKKYMNEMYGWHLHTPDASTHKNGPSAGCAIAAAFVSQILGKYVKHNYAITGEIELTGCIKSIGGLLLKLHGAKMAGTNVVLIPSENKHDLEKIVADSPNLLTTYFNVIMVDNIFDVLKHLLIDYDANDFCLQWQQN